LPALAAAPVAQHAVYLQITCKESEGQRVMAWIKMRTDLMTDPRVVRLAVQLRQPRAMVVGACYVLWCLADQHSEDGNLAGYTEEILDELTGLQGFSAEVR